MLVFGGTNENGAIKYESFNRPYTILMKTFQMFETWITFLKVNVRLRNLSMTFSHFDFVVIGCCASF